MPLGHPITLRELQLDDDLLEILLKETDYTQSFFESREVAMQLAAAKAEFAFKRTGISAIIEDSMLIPRAMPQLGPIIKQVDQAGADITCS